MSDSPQFAGADLARMALANARKAAPNNPAPGRSRTTRKRVVRTGGGRDPISLAAAITGLGADLPLEAGVAGGSITDQWADLCPQYVGCVEPAGYDEQTGRLDLRPASHAYAAQLRLLGGQLAKQINDKMGRPIVRTIRVLPVGPVAAPAPGPAAAIPEQDPPVKTRDMAHPGYRKSLALALENRLQPPSRDPLQEQASQRQIAALRANRQPEDQHREAYWAEADTATEPAPGSMAASERAALARKRQEQAGRTQPRRAFDVA